jgi:hypothetical protein
VSPTRLGQVANYDYCDVIAFSEGDKRPQHLTGSMLGCVGSPQEGSQRIYYH